MPHILDGLYLAIEDAVLNKTTHLHYKRTVELAIKYKQLITGMDVDSLLHQFVRREDDALFAQRKRLTQAITPAVTAAVMNPFYRVGRTNNITRSIDPGKTGGEKLERVNKAIEEFWGEKSLDKYLQTRFTELSFSDPNAFIVTEFDQVPDENGTMVEVPKPRAFEVSSEQAINFCYNNNILEWLIVQLPIKYKHEDKVVIGKSYTIYGPQFSVKFSQVCIEKFKGVQIGTYVDYLVNDGVRDITQSFFRANETEAYLVEEFEHKSKIAPAIRVGYKSDLYTNGSTCVNPFHDGMAYLMKSVKTVSEFDLTISLHAFPQKFMYAPRCSGQSSEISCHEGKTPDGTECHKCKGTGLAVHTTAQDAIIMRLPKDKDTMMDLDKLVYYAQPPIDIVKFQNEYILQLKDEFYRAVFNSELISKAEVAATATEKNIGLQSVYDTLFPYAEHYSDVFVHVTKVSSFYVDVEDVVVIHKFPRDFKMKEMSDLLTELKLANDSNAPGYVREELSNDIAEAQFIDKPDELKKIRIKAKFYPFSDKTDAEILYIISNGKTTKFKEILWANFGDIFTEIEEEQESRDSFYALAYPKQLEIVKGKVEALITELLESEPKPAMPFIGDE